MSTPESTIRPAAAGDSDTENALLQRLRGAAELLEQVGADHSLLETLPKADRDRLQRAVAQVYHPDPAARRLRLKVAERERNAARINREDAVLNATGIRELRRKPVFTTPNYFPPQDFQPHDR
ncbi:MAG TPA: oxidoreductase, partial [Lysobacter sp.]|nr:oxidoreductase [Lysobacter sp.]